MTKPKSRAKEVKAWAVKSKINGAIQLDTDLSWAIYGTKSRAIREKLDNSEKVIRVSIKEIKK